MKPGFALTLSDDGIRLLHRTPRGWMLVGDADLENEAVEDTLRFLRKTATALAPEGVRTKLVLPNSQILYTEVTAPGPDEDSRRAQIEAALAERTPYPIEDLAYDWSGTGETVKVAVVTRLTLSEAEAFAEEHRFNPVCFVSIPEADAFDGEPFFGLTARAADHLPTGATMERDERPVRIVGIVDAVPLAGAPEEAGTLEAVVTQADAGETPAEDGLPATEDLDAALPEDAPARVAETDTAPADALPADAIPSDMPLADWSAAAPTDVPGLPEDGPAAVEELPVAAEPSAPDDDPDATAQAMATLAAEAAATLAADAQPVFAAARQDDGGGVSAQVAPMAGNEPEDSEPDEGTQADATPEPSFAEAASGAARTDKAPAPAETLPAHSPANEVPEAPFAVVDPDGPTDGPLAADAVDATPRTPPLVGGAGFTSRRKLPFGALPPQPSDPGLRPAPRLGPVSSPVGVTAPTLAESDGTDAAEADLPKAAPGAALGEALRKRAGKKAAPPRLAGLRAEPVAPRGGTTAPVSTQLPLRRTAKTAAQESEDLTIFGARRGPAVGGKPRYLGPALIGGLIALIGLVGLWSSLSGDDSAGTEPQTTTLQQSAVEAPAAVPATATDGSTEADGPATPATESDTATTEAASDPALADASLAPLPEAASTVATADPAAADTPPGETAADMPADTATASAEGSTAATVAAAAPQPTATAQPDAPAANAPPPAVESATGPATTAEGTGTNAAQSRSDTTAADSITGETPPTTPDAAALPTGQALLHDAPLAPQPLPLPFGALVKYGPDGLIIPSPEGVQTPTGITLFLGKPPVAPKVRPAKIEAAATAAVAPVPPAEGANATPASAAETPVFADPKLKGKRPAPRPASLQGASGQGAQDQGAATPDAAPLVPVDPRHAARQPKSRPAEILTRAAAAQPAPAPEAVPPAPVTGGTKLAVAQSRRPADRPSDVSKAVESALAAAVAEPEPAAAVTPVVALAPEPAPAPIVPQVDTEAAVAEASSVEIDEPEPVSAAPGIPTRASVAKQATYANAIDLGKVNLIGIMGSSSDRRALIRTSNGRYVRVKVGDRFDGGRVASIGNGQLTYVKGGRTIVLKMLAAG